MHPSVFSFIVFFSFMLLKQDQYPQQKIYKPIEWQLAAKLQNTNGAISTGFAGAINGVSNDVFIVAGGANFPGKLPWQGGEKHYSDEVHVLHKMGNKFIWDKNVNLKLPEPIAYCGNTVTSYGIVYAGGENNKGFSNRAYILTWDAANGIIKYKKLPNLPIAITNIALTQINDIVYAAGGDELNNSSNCFFSIDLKLSDCHWQKLPDMPLPLANTTTIAQNGPDGYNVYVIGGRTKTPSGISELHHSVFKYSILKKTWQKCADITDGKKVMSFSAGAGVNIGKHSILLTGGDNGEVFHKIETYLAKIKGATTIADKEKWTSEKNELNINHMGFYRGVLLYNTLTNSWIKINDLPFAAHVTTTATKWGEDIVLSNGEIKPGVRTPDVMLGKISITEK
jgi:N-acetylneuraminate epimerase